jgi:hypothetical protein
MFLYNGNDLVVGDTQFAPDVFLRDRLLGTTERVNVNSNGEEAQYVSSGGWSNRGSISDNGRYVVFRSFASNLVPSAVAPWDNVYIRDRWKGITKAVPVTSSGVVGNLQSSVGSCSADGRYVAFASTSSNLVPGDTNGWGDVFVRDMMIGGPELSVSNAIAGQSAQLTLSGGSPSGVVFVGASVMGEGLMASPWGPLDLAGPLALFVFAMDASGSVNAQVPIPLALVGRPLWVQGIDVSMNYPTSTWAGWIQ